jgi:hypothetical protein
MLVLRSREAVPYRRIRSRRRYFMDRADAIRYGLSRASRALDNGAQISGTGGIPSSPNRASSDQILKAT